MKGQDILVLCKLLSLSRTKPGEIHKHMPTAKQRGWDVSTNDRDEIKKRLEEIESLMGEKEYLDYLFTVRGLAAELSMSKSEVSNCLKRCMNVNLVKIDRINKKPSANKKLFLEFIKVGLRIVFPAKPAEIVRGIPTTFAAPVLESKLLSAGDLKMVWADPRGTVMGQAVVPLYKSVPEAVKKDADLYASLALLDAIRLGNARESTYAFTQLEEILSYE